MRAFGAVLIAGATLATAAGAAPPVTVSLAANLTLVDYGKPVVLSGAISTKKANQAIAIQATECPSTKAVKASSVKTVANGAYTATLTPTTGTSYQATFKNVNSATVAVSVRPLVLVTRVGRGSFSANVTAGQTLAGKAVLFQRYAKLRKRWVQVKRVVLTTATAAATKPTVVTSAKFRAKVALKSRVRLLLSKAQAAPCYVSATSAVIRS